MASTGHFFFTVTDLARFLGKSPVTLRGWERKGEIDFPRDEGGDRKLSAADVRYAAQVARSLNRISTARQELVNATMTLIDLVERENGL